MKDENLELRSNCYCGDAFNICAGLFSFGLELIESALVIRSINEYKRAAFERNMEALHAFQIESVVDNFKIITFFENYSKAQLILKGVLVHQTNIRHQKKRPIYFSDYAKTFQSESDAVATLSNRTISMSTMLEKDYQVLINLPADVRNAVRRINESRNDLHFLESLTVSHGNQISDELSAIRDFAAQVRSIRERFSLELSKSLIHLPPNSEG